MLSPKFNFNNLAEIQGGIELSEFASKYCGITPKDNRKLGQLVEYLEDHEWTVKRVTDFRTGKVSRKVFFADFDCPAIDFKTWLNFKALDTNTTVGFFASCLLVEKVDWKGTKTINLERNLSDFGWSRTGFEKREAQELVLLAKIQYIYETKQRSFVFTPKPSLYLNYRSAKVIELKDCREIEEEFYWYVVRMARKVSQGVSIFKARILDVTQDALYAYANWVRPEELCIYLRYVGQFSNSPLLPNPTLSDSDQQYGYVDPYETGRLVRYFSKATFKDLVNWHVALTRAAKYENLLRPDLLNKLTEGLSKAFEKYKGNVNARFISETDFQAKPQESMFDPEEDYLKFNKFTDTGGPIEELAQALDCDADQLLRCLDKSIFDGPEYASIDSDGVITVAPNVKFLPPDHDEEDTYPALVYPGDPHYEYFLELAERQSKEEY